MAYPAYESKGTFSSASSSTTIDVSYPSTVNANDILFIKILIFGTQTATTPTNWNLLHGESLSPRSSYTFWKRATGSESGSETVTISSSGNITGNMTRYSGCITTGTPYEDLTAQNRQSGSTATIPEMDTTGVERLAIGLLIIESDETVGSPTDYTEEYQESPAGFSSTYADYSQQIATASTVSSDTVSWTGTEYWWCHGLCLLPTAGAVDNLTADDLVTGNPDLDSPDIGQTHVLAANVLVTQNPVLGDPAIGQIHGLAANDLLTGNPVLGTPSLDTNTDSLTANSLVTGNPDLGLPTLGQIHNLSANSLVTGNPVLGRPYVDLPEDYDPVIKRPKRFNNYNPTFTPIIKR
jgi:hypothetical protein